MSNRVSGSQAFQRSLSVPDDAAFTVMGWARLVTDRNDFSCIAALEGTSYFTLETDSDGTTLVAFFNDGSTDTQSSTLATLTTGTDFAWAIASSGVAAGNTVIYYRAAGSNAWTSVSTGARTAFAPSTLTIGCTSAFVSEWWNGRIWGVKCWDRALSAAELLVESYYSRVMFPASINFHWPLKNASDTRDISGNGRAPTVTGTPTTEDEYGLFAPRRRLFIPAPVVSSGVIYTQNLFESPVFRSRVLS